MKEEDFIIYPAPDLPPISNLPWADLTPKQFYLLDRAREEWKMEHPTEALKDFVKRTHALRKAMGISLRIFARQFGVCYKTAWRWDTGDGAHLPRPEHMEILEKLERMNAHLLG